MRYFVYWYRKARQPIEYKSLGISGVFLDRLPIIDSIRFAWKHRRSKP